MNKKMELLREIINDLIILEPQDDMVLLRKSQEMDLLILQSIKKSNFALISLGNENINEFDIIIDKLQLFENIYQFMRIVDPVRKITLEMDGNKICGTYDIYHEFWKKEIICENGIVIRAFNEGDTILEIVNKGNRSYMVIAIPISIQKKKFVIELFRNLTDSVYHKYEKHGHEVKILTSTEHMNLAAVKDELTGLYNRRYINEKLPLDLINASLRDELLSVIFVNLNFFKTDNDKYGHIAELQVLGEFASELKGHIGISENWAARCGNEEFMVCLSNTDRMAAITVAEKIIKSFRQKKFNVGAQQVQVTFRIGVHTVCNEDECLTIDEMIKLADKKSYQAKEDGSRVG